MSQHSPETIELDFRRRDPDQMRTRAREFADEMARRRSVRRFSSESVPLEVVADCVAAAASAPSGANKQPWTFVLVTDPATKHAIREAAEAVERDFYGGRAPERWREDLAVLETTADKPFLDHAPALIVVFAQKHGGDPSERHYYVNESVGLATGILIAALHHAGLATLTYTPSPMGFLTELLGRPEHERPFLVLPVGYPADGCRVPALTRKSLDQVLVRR